MIHSEGTKLKIFHFCDSNMSFHLQNQVPRYICLVYWNDDGMPFLSILHLCSLQIKNIFVTWRTEKKVEFWLESLKNSSAVCKILTKMSYLILLNFNFSRKNLAGGNLIFQTLILWSVCDIKKRNHQFTNLKFCKKCQQAF